MDILELARTRYTTKHYDASRRIPDALMDELLEVLRLSPSSVNSQPWEFFVAGTDEAKERILPAVLDFNRDRVAKARHVVICAVHDDLNERYLDELLKQEEKDGRLPTEDIKKAQAASRAHFVNLHRVSASEIHAWQARQGYIAQGVLLLAAAALGIDSTPLEGMDFNKLDAVLNLRTKGLRSIYAVSLGYRDPTDSNASRPKSRWPRERIIHTI